MPAQTVELVVEIVTLGVTVGVTVTVILFEFTIKGLAQLALDVNSQRTIWPLVKVVVV